jgi:hypothetical protein
MGSEDGVNVPVLIVNSARSGTALMSNGGVWFVLPSFDRCATCRHHDLVRYDPTLGLCFGQYRFNSSVGRPE